MPTLFAVALGGALGLVLRYLMNNAVMEMVKTPFPLGVMAVNILGGLAMGLLIGLFSGAGQETQTLRSFLMVGVLGGFTTFRPFPPIRGCFGNAARRCRQSSIWQGR